MRVLYSNCIGSHIIENGKVVKTRSFTESERISRCEALAEAKSIPEELELGASFPAALNANKSLDEAALRVGLASFRPADYRETLLALCRTRLRAAVSFDSLLIQAVHAADELAKVSNRLAARLREWYELHCPEWSRAQPEHERFAASIIESPREELLARLGLSAEQSVGAALPKPSLSAALGLAAALLELYRQRNRIIGYIEAVMAENAPNLAALGGPLLGAKLIAAAGSLDRLAKLPASTVQLLGAERALFRHLATGAKAPKHGLILAHPLLAEAKPGQRGKIARALADKLALAARLDRFKGAFEGEAMRKELEVRFGK